MAEIFRSYLEGKRIKQQEGLQKQSEKLQSMKIEDILGDRKRKQAQGARTERFRGLQTQRRQAETPQERMSFEAEMQEQSPEMWNTLSTFESAQEAKQANKFGASAAAVSRSIGTPNEAAGMQQWATSRIENGSAREKVDGIMQQYNSLPEGEQRTQFAQSILEADIAQGMGAQKFLTMFKEPEPKERRIITGADKRKYYADTQKPVLPSVEPAVDAKKDWIKISGVGAYNVKTKEVVGPQQMKREGIEAAEDIGDIKTPVNILSSLSPKVREKVEPKLIEKGYTRTAKYQEEATKARNLANDLERFKSLLNVQETGGALKIPGAVSIATLFGDEEIAEMASISDKLTPAMRQGMPGAASDRDVAMFKSATVGPEKPSDVNRKIADAGIRAAEVLEDKADFMNFYRQNVDASLSGAESEWRKYLNKNPIFDFGDPNVRKNYKLNDDRQTWQDHFKIGVDAATGAPDSTGLPELPPGAVLVGGG